MSRLTGAGCPNGRQALYTYLEDNTQDRRLSQIKHLTPASTLLDEFDYTYDGPLGRIATWNQQQPGATVGAMVTNNYALTYDAIGQLRQAVLNGDSTNPGSSVWSYDPAGNRTGIQAGSGTLSTATVTSTNALFSLSGGGAVQVAGTLSKWANVSVNGMAAAFNAANNTFQAFLPLPLGTQTISISATDVDGNTATNRYQLTISAGAGERFTYDANGNTTALTPSASGSTPETFEWDAADRVTAINIGTHRTQFAYDGNGARVRITEMDNGNVTTDRFYVANEERDVSSGQVLRLFFGQGEQRFGGTTASNYYYALDHLGSTRELTDGTGAVQASYSYDLWGGHTETEGSLDTEIGFTGYWHHFPSMQELSPTRLYDTWLGRWLQRDPIGEKGGINLYGYVRNNPVNTTDPLGLWTLSIGLSSSGGAGVGANGTLGVIVDSNGNFGTFQNVGVGGNIGTPEEGAGAYFSTSNAPDLDSYKQCSVDESFNGGAGLGGSLDYSTWGNGGGPNGQNQYKELGFTVGQQAGASAFVGGSYTTVQQWGNIWTGLVNAWNSFWDYD